jgi:hypothetical protein
MNDVLKKLLAIADKQQQMLVKLAQAMAESTVPNEEANAQKFVQNMTAAWLANNVQQVAYRTSLKKSEDPQFNYEIELVMAPASPSHKIAPDAPAKYKEYMAQKLTEQPLLSNKTVKITPQIVPHL